MVFTIIASLNQYDWPLIHYIERWQIETMFRAMKSSGFILEDTHPTELACISKLLAAVASAFVGHIWHELISIITLSQSRSRNMIREDIISLNYGLFRIVDTLFNPINNNDLTEYHKVLSCTMISIAKRLHHSLVKKISMLVV